MSDAGSYKCLVHGTCGDATSNEATVEVSPSSGVNDDPYTISSTLQVIGPNPASNDVRLSLSLNKPANVAIRIVDQQGAVVLTLNTMFYPEGVTEIVVPLSTLANGVYGIEARTDLSAKRALICVSR